VIPLSVNKRTCFGVEFGVEGLKAVTQFNVISLETQQLAG
jgi:hypothetical protein